MTSLRTERLISNTALSNKKYRQSNAAQRASSCRFRVKTLNNSQTAPVCSNKNGNLTQNTSGGNTDSVSLCNIMMPGG